MNEYIKASKRLDELKLQLVKNDNVMTDNFESIKKTGLLTEQEILKCEEILGRAKLIVNNLYKSVTLSDYPKNYKEQMDEVGELYIDYDKIIKSIDFEHR